MKRKGLNMEKISVILVNYNGKKYNDKCIESILRSTISSKLQIVVVDNASTDNSLQLLQDRRTIRLRLFRWTRIMVFPKQIMWG